MDLNSGRRLRVLAWLLALPGTALAVGDALNAGLAAGDALSLADSLSASGRHREATAHYQSLLDDPPPQWDAWMQARLRLNLAGSQLALGQFAMARLTLQAIEPVATELTDAAGDLQRQIDEVESEALSAQAKGLARLRADPDSVWGYRDLARALALQGRSSQAWSVLQQQLGSLDAGHALAMVEATASIAEPDAAIELALDWLHSHPLDQAIRTALLRLSVDHAPLERALQIHQQHLRVLPDPTLSRYLLARRLSLEGMPDAALAHYQMLLDDRVLGLESHYAVAALHEQLQQPDAALQTLRRAIERWPDYGPAQPGIRGADRSPYTALLGLLCRQQTLPGLDLDWPALSGPNGATIRQHLARARQQAACATPAGSNPIEGDRW
ncbi:MAG: hypothetical protein KDI71_21800 [Xanthomonadales bacterium]|nr:hypothetical protein [Xanthomonadales bacterium]